MIKNIPPHLPGSQSTGNVSSFPDFDHSLFILEPHGINVYILDALTMSELGYMQGIMAVKLSQKCECVYCRLSHRLDMHL